MTSSTFLTASRTMVQTAIHVSRDSFLRTYSLRDSLRSLRTLSQTLAQVLTHVSPSQEEMEKLLKCCYYDTEVDF